jgi:nucleotide-binding universal stress UspA family protein
MIKHILVPLDGSPLAEAVLPHVRDLAKKLGARVTFIQVVSLAPAAMTVEPSAGAMIDPGILTEQMEIEAQEAERYLEELRERWQRERIVARWEVLRGAPASSIVEFASKGNIDLIAMSTRGRSGLGRLVFGSVTDEVMRTAGKPLLIVKPDEQVREQGKGS